MTTPPVRLPTAREQRRRYQSAKAAASARDADLLQESAGRELLPSDPDSLRQSMERLGIELVHVRQLPDEFLRRYLVQQGLTSQQASHIYPRSWVSAAGGINIPPEDEPARLLALAAFRQIDADLKDRPAGETHRQALDRLAQRLRQLRQDGTPTTAIAKALGIDVRAVARLEASDSATRRRCDPWQLLERLDSQRWRPGCHRADVDAEPSPAWEDQSVSDEEVARERARERAAVKAGWHNTGNLPRVTAEGRCAHCNAPPAHLYRNPDSLLNPGLAEHTCRSCGRSSYSHHDRRRP